MKRSLFTYLLIFGLVGLLVLLGALQYQWQSQISQNESEKMHKRVHEDAGRFAADFNREIQNAYFNFQTPSETWKQSNWQPFIKRYEFWKTKTTYPTLIRDFFYFDARSDAPPQHFNAEKNVFEPVEMTPALSELRTRMKDRKNFHPVFDDIYTLAVPIHDTDNKFERMIIRSDEGKDAKNFEMPEMAGYLAVVLDRETITSKILPDLAAKYFADSEFRTSVTDKSGAGIFQSGMAITSNDATSALFDLSPENYIFYANKDLMDSVSNERQPSLVMKQRVESHTMTHSESNSNGTSTMKIEVQRGGPGGTSVTATSNDNGGPWTLAVQHRDGSVDAYVAGVKRRNLAIGFGVLGLLGLAAGAIFVSAQRTRAFAQRQVDFVSSVSHEFRTPLAVIYSAGENLADGVTKERTQITRYGELIKGEGRKLSAMVEQILDFAGAGSGRRKYNMTPTDVGNVVKQAIGECQPLIDENHVDIEIDIAHALPAINADASALTQAVSNLIANSIKYCNGSAWLRVTAANGDGTVKISVEDRGLGISKQDLRHVFEPFYRSREVVDAQIHGNGLGLSLVKQITEAHGGRVTASSELEKGSEFTIEIPSG